jgi:signal transduction histidine kinase
VFWLVLGLLPILIRDVSAIGSAATDLAAGTGTLARAAQEMLHPAMEMTGSVGDYLQYAFSLLNLVLGVLLIVRRPDELVPRLLALGLLGTAATFNLPSHEAFHILGSPWPIAVVHFTFHIVSGVAYLWAVILFPDGRLPNRIAVPGRILGAAVVAVTAAVALVCWWSDFLLHPQFFVIFFGILIPVAGVTSQVLRVSDISTPPVTRRSARLLIGALLPAFALAVLWCAARGLASLQWISPAVGTAADDAAARMQDLFPAVFAIVPVVLFAGVLRYRLFDIDRLLSRVLVYGALVLGAGSVYLLAVVSGAVLVGGASWWTVLVLSASAVALEPAWALAGRWANRVVFGQSLGPEQAMQTLISGLEQVSPAGELQQLVDVTVRATRAVGAQLWVQDGAGLALASTAPEGESAAAGVAPVLVPGRYWPVVHQDERLGVLTVQLAAGESLPAGDRALLADLSSHAGLLVHNAVLARQLSQHVDTLTVRAAELSRSRRRLVAAQDRERRRVERDLHDGAQQSLVAVILGMRSVTMPGLSAADRSSALRMVAEQLAETKTELAGIAGGQLPVALRAGGLLGGLAHAADTARKIGLQVDVAVELTEPIDDDAAAAVYFCCSEALQNVAKYACASHVSVQVHDAAGQVEFVVTDDGAGFEPVAGGDALGGLRGLDDRASLLGGRIAVDSAPGRGTRVRGAIPATNAAVSAGTASVTNAAASPGSAAAPAAGGAP